MTAPVVMRLRARTAKRASSSKEDEFSPFSFLLLSTSAATASIALSMASMAWGAPNPRNAVLEGKLVRHTVPTARREGME